MVVALSSVDNDPFTEHESRDPATTYRNFKIEIACGFSKFMHDTFSGLPVDVKRRAQFPAMTARPPSPLPSQCRPFRSAVCFAGLVLWLAGSSLPVLGSAALFSGPPLEDPHDLALGNAAIVSEVASPPDHTLINVSVTLTNTGSSHFINVYATLQPRDPAVAELLKADEAPVLSVIVGELPPGESQLLDFQLRVPDADLAAVREALQEPPASRLFGTTANIRNIFDPVLAAIDVASLAALGPVTDIRVTEPQSGLEVDAKRLVFQSTTPYLIGLDTSRYLWVDPQGPIGNGEFNEWLMNPRKILSIDTAPSDGAIAVVISADFHPLVDFLIDGSMFFRMVDCGADPPDSQPMTSVAQLLADDWDRTASSPPDPPFDPWDAAPSGSATLQEGGLEAFCSNDMFDRGKPTVPLSLRFNDVLIGENLSLSGAFGMRFEGMSVTVRIRRPDGALLPAVHEVIVESNFRALSNLVLETTGEARFASTEQAVFDLPLPATYVGPFKLTPGFTITFGAEADLPLGLSIPFRSEMVAKMRAGWRDGESVSSADVELIPLINPLPVIFDQVHGSAETWVGMRLYTKVSASGLPTIELPIVGNINPLAPELALFNTTRARFRATIDPGANPWWKTEAGFRTDSSLSFRFLRQEETLPLFGLHEAMEDLAQAAGALTPQPARRSTTAEPAVLSGGDDRWAVAYNHDRTISGQSHQAMASLADGGLIKLNSQGASYSQLSRWTDRGELLWQRSWEASSNYGRMHDIAVLPDGNIIVVGYNSNDLLAVLFDSDGNVLAENRYDVAARVLIYDPRIVGIASRAAGDFSILVAGHGPLSFVDFRSQPFVVSLDETGEVEWAKSHVVDRDMEVADGLLLEDGRMVLVGQASVPTGSGSAADAGALLLLAPDGTCLEAHCRFALQGALFSAVAAKPDGTLVIAGRANADGAFVLHPRIFVTEVDLDQPLDAFAFNFYFLNIDPPENDVFRRGRLPFLRPEDSAAFDGGVTLWDLITDLEWVGDGFVGIGNSGIGTTQGKPVGTYTGQSNFLFHLLPDLRLSWMSFLGVHHGADFIEAVAPMENGFAVAGAVRSDPTSPLPLAPNYDYVMRLPMTGRLAFTPESNLHKRFVQPQTRSEFLYADSYFGGQNWFGNTQAGKTAVVAVTDTDITSDVVRDTAFSPADPPETSAQVFPIPFEDPARAFRINGFAEYMASFGLASGADLSPGGNPDGDAYSNLEEWFRGSNPSIPDPFAEAFSFLGTSASSGLMEQQVNPDAHDVLETWQTSTNLQTWTAVPWVSAADVLLPDGRVRQTIEVNRPAGSPSATFWRRVLELP